MEYLQVGVGQIYLDYSKLLSPLHEDVSLAHGSYWCPRTRHLCPIYDVPSEWRFGELAP
jgi:hypothetical protein